MREDTENIKKCEDSSMVKTNRIVRSVCLMTWKVSQK